jgi:hypothetical protein
MIVGILTGFFSLIYVGVLGSLFGGFVQWADPAQHMGMNGTEIRFLSIVLPLLAITGGAVSGGSVTMRLVGGALLLLSAAGHWYLLGFSPVSQVFILSLGLAGILAFVAAALEPAAEPAMAHGNAIVAPAAVREASAVPQAPTKIEMIGTGEFAAYYMLTEASEFRENPNGFTIGRGNDAVLSITDDRISRAHARLGMNGTGFFIEDLGSANGVSINSRDIPRGKQVIVRNGDIVSIGPARFNIQIT